MEDRLKVNLNEYLPLRDIVFNTLREAILTGELVPGERLMEKQLAERMGVSRTPIREAIRKLELEGLVNMIPRKGAEVSRITEKDIENVLEVRCVLEELAATLSCQKITEEELEELYLTLQEFKIAIRRKDVEQIIDKDVKFHDIIFSSTGNDKLIAILNNLREQIYRFRVEYIRKASKYTDLVEEHEKIYETIKTKNEKEARIIAREHITNQETAVITYLKESEKK